MSLQRVALIGKSPSRSFGDVCATVSGMAPANNTIPTIEANNCVELIMRCPYLGTLHAAPLRLRSRIPTNLPEKGLKIIVPAMSAVSLRYAFMVCPVRLRRQSSLPQAGGRTVLAARAQMAVPRPAVVANSRPLTRQERSCGRYGRTAESGPFSDIRRECLTRFAGMRSCSGDWPGAKSLPAIAPRSRTMNASPRWKRRPQGSTWGDFGSDDELGRLNLLTPEKVKQGVAEVREGLSFCLSLPLDYPGGNLLNPRRHPPVLRPTLRSKRPNMNYRLAFDDPNLTDVVSDDVAILHLQYSTQWDSLAHVGSLFDADGDEIPEPVYYNGYRADEHIVGPADVKDAGGIDLVEAKSTSQARALGVENMAQKCVQGRGVMIDLHAHVGRERALIGYDELMRVLDHDKVEVEPGDMVLLIADNYAVEAFPSVPHAGCCAALPLHEHCLFKLGVNLGELWLLSPLARWLREHQRYRFLLTAPPLRLPGAVGSPATPVATV